MPEHLPPARQATAAIFRSRFPQDPANLFRQFSVAWAGNLDSASIGIGSPWIAALMFSCVGLPVIVSPKSAKPPESIRFRVLKNPFPISAVTDVSGWFALISREERIARMQRHVIGLGSVKPFPRHFWWRDFEFWWRGSGLTRNSGAWHQPRCPWWSTSRICPEVLSGQN